MPSQAAGAGIIRPGGCQGRRTVYWLCHRLPGCGSQGKVPRQVPPCVRGSYLPRGDDLWRMRLSADIGRSWWNTSSLVCSVWRWLHECSPLPGRSVVSACRTLPVTGSGVAAVAV